MKQFACDHSSVALFSTSKTHLAEAIKYMNKGNYDLSFSFFRRSVVASCRLIGFAAGKMDAGMESYQIEDKFEGLTDLLDVIGQRDEKLDMLFGFLADSDRQATDRSNREGVCFYRQMVLSLIASIPNRNIPSEQVATAKEYEDILNFKFAMASYLETFIDYQRWCLEFIRKNWLQPKGVAHTARKIRQIAALM